MAMKPYKRAVAVTGSYEDRGGNTKKRYTPVGTLFQYDDGGFALKLDAAPIGGEGWISFFDLDRKDGDKPASGGGGSSAREDFSVDDGDQIPFATPYGLR